MYKHHSPEALSLASLGRADSKRADKTCRGITTAGRPCRKPIKKGSREKFCHLHRDQQSTYRARLLGARTAIMTIVEEYEDDSIEDDSMNKPNTGYPTPAPSPSPPRRNFPARKPVPTTTFPAKQDARPPSLQLSPPPSIPPPTPPLSIPSPNLKPVPQKQKKGSFKLGRAIQNIFRPNLRKSTSPKVSVHRNLSLGTTLRRNDIFPMRYPQIIPPTTSKPSTPLTQPPARPTRNYPPRDSQYLPPSPRRTPKQFKSAQSNVPLLQGRPPAPILALAQSRTATGGVQDDNNNNIQKSWKTMWVPGIDGLGAHIICEEWLSPDLTSVGRQKLLSCMHAPLSAGEESGYIYVYKVSEDKSAKNDVFYKVGRTQNLTRRLYQWSRSCPYTPLLVEFFPTPPAGTLQRTPSASSISSLFQRGEMTPQPPPNKIVKCAVTHRVERLIHLELEDRFGRLDYLSGAVCQCGKIHKEWFRGGKGGPGDKSGWAEVRDVIVRWVGFGRIAYGEVVV